MSASMSLAVSEGGGGFMFTRYHEPNHAPNIVSQLELLKVVRGDLSSTIAFPGGSFSLSLLLFQWAVSLSLSIAFQGALSFSLSLY